MSKVLITTLEKSQALTICQTQVANVLFWQLNYSIDKLDQSELTWIHSTFCIRPRSFCYILHQLIVWFSWLLLFLLVYRQCMWQLCCMQGLGTCDAQQHEILPCICVLPRIINPVYYSLSSFDPSVYKVYLLLFTQFFYCCLPSLVLFTQFFNCCLPMYLRCLPSLFTAI